MPCERPGADLVRRTVSFGPQPPACLSEPLITRTTDGAAAARGHDGVDAPCSPLGRASAARAGRARERHSPLLQQSNPGGAQADNYCYGDSANAPLPARPSLPGLGVAVRRAGAFHVAHGWSDASAGGAAGVQGAQSSPGVASSGNSFIMNRQGCIVTAPCDERRF